MKGDMPVKRLSFALFVVLAAACSWNTERVAAAANDEGTSNGAGAERWVDLFDGRSLRGWAILSGYAKYEAKDGMIVGTTAEGSLNTFLCTIKSYGDFVLEFEVKVDPRLNSGVQFRSGVYPKETAIAAELPDGKKVIRTHYAGRVYGYQVEIASQRQGESGNVYDEARRARMLDDFSNKPEARTAIKDNQWNRYRVECRGESIKTWINDVPCADFRDSMSARGLIGLQVHRVSDKNYQPYQVFWRNIRIRELAPDSPSGR
jgi:hypothetical protein